MTNLTSWTIHRTELSPADIQSMFAVFRGENFEQTSQDIFQRVLLESKDWVILLRDESDRVQGFSTLALYETEFESQKMSLVYSGDTIIRREFWGTPQLPREWIHTVLEKSQSMQQPLYWLLISSGYKTYCFLSVFYKTFYPHYAIPTPLHIQSLMHHLASQHFGDDYIPALGVVRFKVGATPLRDGVAEVTYERLHDPHVAHYIK